MDANKYQRSVSLHCPTCGGTSFEINNGVDQTIEMAKCVRCSREIPKDELIRENEEHISEEISNAAKEISSDVEKNFREILKKSVRGSKNIKIR